MNPESYHSESDPLNSPTPTGATPSPPQDWRYWARRLLVCNPFFLVSAALLLWGVNRLSADDSLFAGELQNLYFNFSVLQFYEVLVVITAVVLARRKVWYDSALLVVLDHGLALFPFMLISQATLQGEAARDGLSLAATLSIGGGMVTVARGAVIRRWYPQFNLPGRSLILGALVLAGNVALPLLFRPRMEKDVADWQDENLLLWYLVLPLVTAGANLLRRPVRYHGSNPERPWLPLFIYGLWTAGSAVHVWSIAHICEIPLRLHQLAPLACAVAWTLYHRLADFCPQPAGPLRTAVLITATLSPLLAFAESHLFFGLMSATGVTHFIMFLRTPSGSPLRSFKLHLATLSFALVVAGMPLDWGSLALPDFARSTALGLAAGLFALAYAIQSRHPAAGMAGACALFGVALFYASPLGMSFFAVLQFSLVYLLLHSLAWTPFESPRTRLVQGMAATAWMIDALIWTRDPTLSGLAGTVSGSIVVIVGWIAICRTAGIRRPRMPLLAAIVCPCSSGANWVLQHSSDGLLIVLGSFAVFAIGAAVAWTRHRWETPGSGVKSR